MGTCGFVGQIGVYAGWVNDVASGAKAAITSFDWAGLILISFVLPAILCWAFGLFFRKIGWIGEGDLTCPGAEPSKDTVLVKNLCSRPGGRGRFYGENFKNALTKSWISI